MMQAGDPERALRYVVEAAQKDLEDRSRIEHVNIATSGSTLVLALRNVEQDCVWVATVGDSRAALLCVPAPESDGSPGGPPTAEVAHETVDHKPSREDEQARIFNMGGDVVAMRYHDGNCDYRVYFRGKDRPGIALSRSMGDCEVKAIGVTAEPDVVRWSLRGLESAHLLLCSDGVWEFLSTQQVADIVIGGLRKENPHRALKQLLETSKALWSKKVGNYCDDITMVLAPLGQRQAPRVDDLRLMRGESAGGDGFMNFMSRARRRSNTSASTVESTASTGTTDSSERSGSEQSDESGDLVWSQSRRSTRLKTNSASCVECCVQ